MRKLDMITKIQDATNDDGIVELPRLLNNVEEHKYMHLFQLLDEMVEEGSLCFDLVYHNEEEPILPLYKHIS